MLLPFNEICTSRFTKCCACHDICFEVRKKCCACHEICASRFTNHERLLGNLAFYFPKQFTVRGSPFFLKMCPPFVSLLLSALFRWPCSISIHVSPRSVTGVRPFPLAMQHFFSFVSQVCHCCVLWCPPFSAGHVAFLGICFPGLSLLVSALFRWPCSFVSQVCHWCPPFSAGHAAFLFIWGLGIEPCSRPGAVLCASFEMWKCHCRGRHRES